MYSCVSGAHMLPSSIGLLVGWFAEIAVEAVWFLFRNQIRTGTGHMSRFSSPHAPSFFITPKKNIKNSRQKVAVLCVLAEQRRSSGNDHPGAIARTRIDRRQKFMRADGGLFS